MSSCDAVIIRAPGHSRGFRIHFDFDVRRCIELTREAARGRGALWGPVQVQPKQMFDEAAMENIGEVYVTFLGI